MCTWVVMVCVQVAVYIVVVVVVVYGDLCRVNGAAGVYMGGTVCKDGNAYRGDGDMCRAGGVYRCHTGGVCLKVMACVGLVVCVVMVRW